MRWFGPYWDAPVCDEGEQVPVPIGKQCELCSQEIEADARGLVLVYYTTGSLDDFPVHLDWPVHLDCLLKNVSGSAE